MHDSEQTLFEYYSDETAYTTMLGIYKNSDDLIQFTYVSDFRVDIIAENTTIVNGYIFILLLRILINI